MATTREQLEELRTEIRRLKRENAETRRVLRRHGLLTSRSRTASPRTQWGLSERERARVLLRNAGVTRELTPEEKKLAAEWRALSKNEQGEVEDALRHVRLDRPLSQLIHDMRD